MLFSIVVPVYNVEKYLRECIENVLSQTYTNFELILVDDGSKDSSGAICDEYAEKDDRVRVIHKQNAGSSMARNDGVNNAKGKYITFIDSDDYICDDNWLLDISKAIENRQSDIIIYKYKKWFEKDRTFADCGFSFKFAQDMSSFNEFMIESVKHNAYTGMAWNKVMKKELYCEFEPGLLGEDMEWFFGMCQKLKTVTAIDKSYVVYRQRTGSISHSVKLKNLTDFIYIVEKWSSIYKEFEDAQKKEAIFGALSFYYSNLLIVYSRVIDKAKQKEKARIKALSWVLDYSKDSRSGLVGKFYKLLGFDLTVLALKVFDKIKG